MMPRRAEISPSARCASSPSRSRGNSGPTSTQNDWKLDVPQSGSATARRPGELGDLLGVGRGDLATPRDDLRQPAQLDDADGGLQVRHPVVVADLEVLLRGREHAGVPGRGGHAHRVLAQAPRPLRPLGVGRREHAALARGDDLARVERPRRDVGAGADGPAAVGRARAAGRVLDHDDPARVRHGAGSRRGPPGHRPGPRRSPRGWPR